MIASRHMRVRGVWLRKPRSKLCERGFLEACWVISVGSVSHSGKDLGHSEVSPRNKYPTPAWQGASAACQPRAGRPPFVPQSPVSLRRAITPARGRRAGAPQGGSVGTYFHKQDASARLDGAATSPATPPCSLSSGPQWFR